MVWSYGENAIKIFAIVISCLIILLTVVFFVVKAGVVPDTIFAGKRAVENIAFLHALEEIPMNLFNICLDLFTDCCCRCFD